MALRSVLLLAVLLAAAAHLAAARTAPLQAMAANRVHPVFSPAGGARRPAAVTPAATSFGISYHGGRLLTNPINVYLIWYGGQWTQAQKNIIADGVNSFSKAASKTPDMTKFWAIDTGYTQGTGGAPVSSSVKVAAQHSDTGSYGTSNLQDSTIQSIVLSSINAAAWPEDSNAMYFVLTSAEVTLSGFCSSFCGYHGSFSDTYGTGQDVLYATAGDATSQCPNGCQPQFQPTSAGGNGWKAPNGNNGADAIMSVVAHEISECASDPDTQTYPPGWYDNRTGEENADYCAYTWGTTFAAPNGGRANHWGINSTASGAAPRAFLVQQNYSLKQKACVTVGP